MKEEKPTIIHLFSHKPNPVCLNFRNPEDYIKKYDNAEYIKIDKFPYWVGFFKDFHHKMAVDVMEVTDKYNHECWRPYWNFIGNKYEKMFDGVLHKVYPSNSVRLPKIDEWMWSRSLLKDLKLRLSKNEKLILHIHDGHSNFITWVLLHLKPTNIPVIYQHRGGRFANFEYKYRKKNPVFLINFSKQKRTLKYITHYLCGSRMEYDFLKNEIKLVNMSFYMDGVDFDYFVPGDKVEARKKLNLPLDKKIILNVGRFDAVNGVQNLLNLYKRLKSNNYNVVLLLVGGYKSNPLYQAAIDEGAIVVERVHEPKLRDYYQASDIYSLATGDYFYQRFAGFGTTPIQSLACGVPVLSFNIIHLPGSMEEINKIGRMFETEEELYKNTVSMLDNIDEFKDCRNIAKKYYDKKTTIKNLIDKYDELFDRFYSN